MGLVSQECKIYNIGFSSNICTQEQKDRYDFQKLTILSVLQTKLRKAQHTNQDRERSKKAMKKTIREKKFRNTLKDLERTPDWYNKSRWFFLYSYF